MKRILAAMGLILPFVFSVPALAEGLGDTSSILVLIGLVVVMIGVVLLFSRRVKWNAHLITKIALSVALGFLLGMIRLFRMPAGGSIALFRLLPLVLLTYAIGPVEGMVAGVCLGLLKLFLDPYVIHPVQMLLDYPITYAMVALSALARLLPDRMERWKLPIACLLGYFGHYITGVLSGVIFFASYAGEQNALVYSLVYNITYLGPEAVACAAVALLPGMNRLIGIIRKNTVRK